MWSTIIYEYIWKMLLTFHYFSFESVHGETMLKKGVGGKEIEFFLLNGNKLVKMHSDGKLIHLAINIY